jgi:arabinan endo-1,5-alpha-L-arabinosidase
MLSLLLTGREAFAEETPSFRDVSVHDPSIIRAEDGTFYIYGSHMAAAKSTDLIAWDLISKDATNEGCTLFDDVQTELSEALAFSRTNTFWAPDVQRLRDGRYYYYYCTCIGNAPLSTLGVAVADSPEGPYTDLGIILKSGLPGYDATVLPNVIDPNVFFDNDGRLWMLYGSYSGGIYILEMNPDTGFPLEGQPKYGKKLLGKNHSRIEGPYIIYSPDTEYYYLFLSFGGLNANDGYNIRVCRSKNPDGPYEDALGQQMINCGGRAGTFFNDADIEGYGVKLMGGYQFRALPEESNKMSVAYRSPGHNSAYYDAETGRYFLIFHTRFANAGESHTVRVHQMYMNGEGWPVVSPQRYAGETNAVVDIDRQSGVYKVVAHGRDINTKHHVSERVELLADGAVSGAYAGTWSSSDGANQTSISLVLDGVGYSGVFAKVYDSAQGVWTIGFTALSADGAALWGSASTAKE